jgi:hypothetical protein
MRKTFIASITIGLTTLLAGCGATIEKTPPSPLANMDVFTIIVPKNADNTNTWNVNFKTFSHILNGSTQSIRKYYSAKPALIGKDKLDFNFCNVEQFSSGSVFKSCITYTSDVVLKDLGESTQITIKPTLRTESKDGFLIPISLPKVNHQDIYSYLSSHTISTSGKITSDFPSESIKGNFDRLASKYRWKEGEADAAHRRFKDTYIIRTSNGIEAIVGAGFFPYRKGSIVQYSVQGVSSSDNAIRTVDWKEAMDEITKTIENIVNS